MMDDEIYENNEVSSADDGAGTGVSDSAPGVSYDPPMVMEPEPEEPQVEFVPEEPQVELAPDEIESESIVGDIVTELFGEAGSEEEYFTYEVVPEPEEPRLFFDTPFVEYTPTEGLLLLIFFLSFVKTILSAFRGETVLDLVYEFSVLRELIFTLPKIWLS